jgi:hypothetical protein
MEVEFENGFKRKVVGLVKMYNFGVLSFLSFHIKVEVIFNLQKSKKVSPFDFKLKFQNSGRIWGEIP